MNNKTPEEVLALAKQCGACLTPFIQPRSVCFRTYELQAFAAALTAAQPVQPKDHKND